MQTASASRKTSTKWRMMGNGLAMVAGVPVHLAAAGLVGREIDRVPEALEHAHHSLAGLGKERVVVAGNE